MAFTDHDSAIDNTFEVNVFPAPLSSAPGVASSYGGARAGHWSARSGTVSAIDDRCPTVCNKDYGVGGGHDEEDEPIRAIGGDLLKRLKLATIEEERKKPLVQEIAAGSVHTVPASEKSKESKTRRFHVPAYIGGRELDQSAKLTKQEKRPPVVKTKEEKKLRIDTVPAAPASTTHSKGQGIRITSKDGREAFVTLPNQAYVTSAPPTAPISSSHRRHNEENEQTQASGAAHDNARNDQAETTANVFKGQVKPMNVGQSQAKKNKTKTKKQEQLVLEQNQSKLAQGFKNGGDATVIVESKKGSIKDAGIGFGNFFDDIPVPKAPSAAPSAAVRAKSLISAVRSISENSRTNGQRPDAWVSNEKADVRRTSGWSTGSIIRNRFSATSSDAVLGASRETLANMSQHSGKSDNGWHAPSACVGSWRDRRSGGWEPARTSMSSTVIRGDVRTAVKSISAHSRGLSNGWESLYNSHRSGDHVRHGHTLHPGLRSGGRSRVVAGDKDGLNDMDGLNDKDNINGRDMAFDRFGAGSLEILDIDRASTLKPWDASQSGALSMQSIRDRVRTINENSERSSGHLNTAFVRSEGRSQVRKQSTRRLRVHTGMLDHKDVAKSAVSWHSRAHESVRSDYTAADGWGQAVQPSYNGFRVVGEGFINARFESEQGLSRGIRERGEGWIYPRSEFDMEVKQHSSEPPRRPFHGQNSSSIGAASQRIPPKSTIFAGAGWIEGHPLSVAPSSCRTPVQSHIGLPEGADRKLPVHHRGKKNLSFEEWQEVQQSTFQAEGTVDGSIRSEGVPPSVASDSVYSKIRQYTSENKPPSVLRTLAPSSRKSGHHGGWSEKDGEVHLHMPWDRS
ncbi:hypothetical protein LTR78_000121 [Recurvomyces mirabilis]|uniref:Uncharacterized protein n=1 Tax=Recurvomyces mirabilis TaxID=574656 RepID=A0AAE1C661_9PEZI|nr:hypothetical protein LTR78_000121 [Recurvomyces mirabilis]KAK5161778.1 hypothetical protein LTS14_000123 [Recurvomyces mirabilis]